MIARIADYYRNAKWVKWIEIVCFPIIGLWLIMRGYSFLQDDLVNDKGLFYIIAGSFWIICAGLEWIVRYLSEIGKLVTKITQTLLVIVAVVLMFMV